MTRRLLFSLLAVPSVLCAEPLMLEQASNVATKGRLEIGLLSNYGTDEFTLKGQAGTDYDFSVLTNSLFFRYGLGTRWEVLGNVPHISWVLDKTASGQKTSTSESGLGDVTTALKWNFLGNESEVAWAVLLAVDWPTGDEKKALGAGLDVHPQVVWSGPRTSRLLWDANAGYLMTGDYEVGTTKTDPGDAITYGVSAGLPWRAWTLLTELRGETIGEEKQNSQKVAGSDGTQLNITPGARYQWKNIKFKAGVDLSLGEESLREYDWQAFLGISLLGRFSFSMQ